MWESGVEGAGGLENCEAKTTRACRWKAFPLCLLLPPQHPREPNLGLVTRLDGDHPTSEQPAPSCKASPLLSLHMRFPQIPRQGVQGGPDPAQPQLWVGRWVPWPSGVRKLHLALREK